jgi:hypothetical protein
VKPDAVGLVRKYDSLINYMYVPPAEFPETEFALPESVAPLYMPVTLHHDLVEGNRVTQLAQEGAKQLMRKLVWLTSGWLEPRDFFEPPLD